MELNHFCLHFILDERAMAILANEIKWFYTFETICGFVSTPTYLILCFHVSRLCSRIVTLYRQK